MATLPTPVSRALRTPTGARVVDRLADVVIGAPPVRRRIDGLLRPTRRHRVSVVMPSYGYAQFLPTAVRSAALQEDVDVEVIVVDDCGPDDSLAVAHQQAARYPQGRVTVIANERNMGHTRTFDRGVAAATGDFLVRLDADDELAPGALARAVAVMESCPSVGLVYGPVVIATSADHPPVPEPVDPRAVVYRGQDWMRYAMREDRNLITTPEVMLRMSVLADVGPWAVDLPHSTDLEMWLRTAAVSDVAHVEGCYQAVKHNHEANMSATAGYRGTTNLEAHRDGYEHLFAQVATRLPDAQELHDQARRAVGDRALDEVVHAYTRGKVDPEHVGALMGLAREVGTTPRQEAWLRRALDKDTHAPRDPVLLARAVARAARRELMMLRWERRGL